MAQTEAINIEGMDGLKKLISDKQVKIDEINKIDEEFGVYFARLKQKLGINKLEEIKSSDLKGAKELQQTIGQIMELLKEINELEKHNNEKAKGFLNDLGAKIRQIKEGKKLSNAYSPGTGLRQPSYFIDKKK